MAILSAKIQNNMIIRTDLKALLLTFLIYWNNVVQLGDGVDFAFAKSRHSDQICHKTSVIASKRMTFCVSIVKGSVSFSADYKKILSKDDGFVIVNTRKSKMNISSKNPPMYCFLYERL